MISDDKNKSSIKFQFAIHLLWGSASLIDEVACCFMLRSVLGKFAEDCRDRGLDTTEITMPLTGDAVFQI